MGRKNTYPEDSEKLFSKIFSSGFDALLLTSPDGRIYEANPAACRMFGKTEMEIILGGSQGLVDMTDTGLPDFLTKHEKSGWDKGELTFVRADGSKFRAEVTSVIFSDSCGEVKTLMLIRDLTEKIKCEETVRISEEKYLKIFHASPDIIFLTTLDEGIIVDVNERLESVLGYKRDEVIGKKTLDLDFWADPALRDKFVAILLEEDCVRDMEVQFRTKSGQLKDTVLSGEIIVFRTGRHILGVIHDISEQKKFMEAQTEREELLRLSTEMVNVAVWEYNSISNSMSRSVNHDRLYGLESQLLWNIETFLNAIHPDDRDFSNRIIQRSVAPGGPDNYRFEFRVIYPDESVHWLEVAGKVIKRNEKGEGIIIRGAIIDISHLKRIQELLHSSEKKFETLFRSAAMPVILTSLADNIVVDVNEAWIKLFGYNSEEVVGRTMQDLGYYGNTETNGNIVNNVEKGDSLVEGELTLFRKSGTPVEVITSMNVVEIDGREYTLTSIYNITDRKIAEDRLAKQTRLYSVLSRINELLVREKNKERLFYETCKIIVTCGGFRMAWIGLLGNDNLKVYPAAYYGYEEGYLKIRTFSGDANVDAVSCPTGETIRSGSYYVCNDITNDPVMIPWREEALERGYRSSIAIALRKAGAVIGTLNIYAETKDFFDNSEIKLLNTLAENISYTLDSIEYEEGIKKSREEFRDLAMHIDSIRENERKSIAMNLHDDLGQKLTAIKMDLNRFRLRVGDSDRDMENRLKGMMELIDDTIKTVQKISSELRPAILYDLGLKDAIEWHILEFSRSTGIKYALSIMPEEFTLEEKLSVTVFRILQEALTNVARHSSATEVRLNLEVIGSAIKLILADNGKGIDPAMLRSHKSFGLISMRERAESLSGKLEIFGAVGKGTEVKLEIPVR